MQPFVRSAHRLVKKKIFGAAVVAVWIIAGLTSTISVFNVYLDSNLESTYFFTSHTCQFTRFVFLSSFSLTRL